MNNPVKDVVRSIARRAAGTGRLEERLAGVRTRLDGIGKRQQTYETQWDEINRRLQQIEERLNSIGNPVQEVARRQDRLEKRVVADKVDPALARIQALEDDVQECRQLNRRIAELTDVVGQVLLPSSDRDEQALRERLTAFNQQPAH